MRLFLLLCVWLSLSNAFLDSAKPSFLEQTDFDDYFRSGSSLRPGQNPLDRDEDDLPNDPDDKGSESLSGHTDWILITVFDAEVPGSGQVWAVPRKESRRDESFVLIAGLQSPTGICFDKNHDFLYVCDPGQRRVFQFEIDRDGANRFVLASDQVATIYEGLAPSDCAVDAYGNLYLPDMITQSILIFDYLDLWSGILNANRTIYAATDSVSQINRPVGIDVYRSETIYFVNAVDGQDSGVLDSAPAAVTNVNDQDITVRLRSDLVARGLGLSDDYAYISGADGSIWAFDFHGDPNLFLKSSGFFSNPRGICTGDGRVYVADYDLGEVYSFRDNNDEDVEPRRLVGVEGAYGLACINA